MRFLKFKLFMVLLVLFFGLMLGSAWGQFVVVEDFEGLTPGSIDGQNGWTASSGTLVSNDPDGVLNQVLAVTGTATIAKGMLLDEGTSGMFFLRFQFAKQLSGSFGLSHLASPVEFDDFGPELNLTSSSNDLRIANGGTSGVYDVLTELDTILWYNVWLLVNNTDETTQVWLNSTPYGSVAPGDKLGGSYDFRTSTSNDLVNFFIKTASGGSGEFGPLYIDDIYMENASVLNLTNPLNPVPLPSALWFLGSGLIGLFGFRKKSGKR